MKQEICLKTGKLIGWVGLVIVDFFTKVLDLIMAVHIDIGGLDP